MDEKLFCRHCDIIVSVDTRSQVLQHMKTAKHQRYGASSSSAPTQQALTLRSEQSVFNERLARMMVAADIPFTKLTVPAFRDFLETECRRMVPEESTIRKNYVPVLVDKCMSKVKDALQGKYVWIQIDETTDACGRYVTNVVAGTMNASREVRVLHVATCANR